MTTIEEVNEKIMAIENKIEAIETTLGFEQGKDLLTSLYTNLAELRKEKNALLGQTGKRKGEWEQSLQTTKRYIPHIKTEGPVNWHSDIVVPLSMIPLYTKVKSILCEGGYVLLHGPCQYGKTSIADALCEDNDLSELAHVCIYTLTNVTQHDSSSDFWYSFANGIVGSLQCGCEQILVGCCWQMLHQR
ncbi:7089_t:CDS:2 [Paraglomus brasilianum]|uniref:7089_t:CDS:1 n=1 Tax=Paraglomus brasilianum TaxID=144538 RepID=A0A9N9HD00_9GLOM|nr:7089_t:CDS:2 [Paraglomus brasilianum]